MLLEEANPVLDLTDPAASRRCCDCVSVCFWPFQQLAPQLVFETFRRMMRVSWYVRRCFFKSNGS
jgi:hypothetical protein